MLSTIISGTIFVVSFISFAGGNVVKRTSGFDAALECLQEGFNAEGAEVQSAGGHIDTDTDKIHASCQYSKVGSSFLYLYRKRDV